MNCRKAEEHIYLYNELSADERDIVNKHMENCAACRQVFERARTVEILSSRLADVPGLSDESAMTQRIMRAVNERKQEKQSLFTSLFSSNMITPLRYGMTALSLFLIVHFVDEYSTGAIAPVKVYPVRGAQVELNTASFHDALVTARDKKNVTGLFYECISKCLQREQADCIDCKDLQKKFKLHEKKK
jgi:anti-sigma factor RsiW